MKNKLTAIITTSAKEHFKKIIKEGTAIKLGLKKSGCSGFAYTIDILEIDKKESDCDLFYLQTIPFIAEKEHLSAFNNCIIDYKKEGFNYKIVFENPNAYNHCGCGDSFALNT